MNDRRGQNNLLVVFLIQTDILDNKIQHDKEKDYKGTEPDFQFCYHRIGKDMIPYGDDDNTDCQPVTELKKRVHKHLLLYIQMVRVNSDSHGTTTRPCAVIEMNYIGQFWGNFSQRHKIPLYPPLGKGE
jgi:hypothetical protein